MFNFHLSIRESENLDNDEFENTVLVISFIRKYVAENLFNDYDVTNVFDNDNHAIMSRIHYIEMNEPPGQFFNIF